MEYETELYAERLRRQAQAAALASGKAEWTTELKPVVVTKLHTAWGDALDGVPTVLHAEYDETIRRRTLRSLGSELTPAALRAAGQSDAHKLSLIEAEHEALSATASEFAKAKGSYSTSAMRGITSAPDRFRDDVNRIFEAHIVGFHLHDNSRLVPVQSHEMHNAVVAPTLYLLHSQPRFSGAEVAYQNALRELRNGDAADAITDAATALQEVLIGIGCKGGALGDLIASAKKTGLLTGADTPLTESIIKTANWVAAQRNQGEAHRGDPNTNLSDAWMTVHVVGALAIRLAETSAPDV